MYKTYQENLGRRTRGDRVVEVVEVVVVVVVVVVDLVAAVAVLAEVEGRARPPCLIRYG